MPSRAIMDRKGLETAMRLVAAHDDEEAKKLLTQLNQLLLTRAISDRTDGLRAEIKIFGSLTEPPLRAYAVTLLNIRSAATIEEFARKLMRLHRPTDPLALPDFIRPRVATAVHPADALRDRAAAAPNAPSKPAADPEVKTDRRKLVCATCGSKITFSEGKFCWNNERRFGGLQYCREHQTAFR